MPRNVYISYSSTVIFSSSRTNSQGRTFHWKESMRFLLWCIHFRVTLWHSNQCNMFIFKAASLSNDISLSLCEEQRFHFFTSHSCQNKYKALFLTTRLMKPLKCMSSHQVSLRNRLHSLKLLCTLSLWRSFALLYPDTWPFFDPNKRTTSQKNILTKNVCVFYVSQVNSRYLNMYHSGLSAVQKVVNLQRVAKYYFI